jgi:hypothetical protein
MVVLTSPDGSAWSVGAEYPEVFAGVSPFGLFATNVGLMIIGLADEGALVMISDDGVSWTQVPDDDDLSGVGLNSATSGGSGVVAVGIYHIDPDWHAAILSSPDGQTWTRVAHNDALFGDAALASVAEGSDRLVAVGGVEDPPLATVIVVSEDGLVWERVSRRDDVFGDSVMRSVARLDGGFLAGGNDSDGLDATLVDSCRLAELPFGGASIMWRFGRVLIGGVVSVAVDREGVEIRAIQDLVNFDGMRVLEVGCGSGRLTWRYAQDTSSVVALDVNGEAIREATNTTPPDLRSKVTFMATDIAAFGVPESKFDVAVLSYSL